MRTYQYFVYIMASQSGTLYVGMTNNLLRRWIECLGSTGKRKTNKKMKKKEKRIIDSFNESNMEGFD